MPHCTLSILWSVLALVELTVYLVCTKASDWAESCEVLEVRLRDVEAEGEADFGLKISGALRSDSRSGFVGDTHF